MQQALFDAHCHPCGRLSKANLSVVNGTSPSDWTTVVELAKNSSKVIPAIGLHPWRVNEVADNWQALFLDALPHARVIGEIGLDQWISDCNLERQLAAFCWQLRQAWQHNLPVTIHCLRASDALLKILKQETIPRRGIHLHAYNGSAEQAAQFIEMGAYFSFHAGQLNRYPKKAIATVQSIPIDRILIETDAPDTLGVSNNISSFLMQGYELVAELKDMSIEVIQEQVDANFRSLFKND